MCLVMSDDELNKKRSPTENRKKKEKRSVQQSQTRNTSKRVAQIEEGENDFSLATYPAIIHQVIINKAKFIWKRKWKFKDEFREKNDMYSYEM